VAAQWIWIYGLKPREQLSRDPADVESRWLNNQTALTPAQRDGELRILVSADYTNRFGQPMPPIFTHVWWTAYNPQTRGWAPWVRFNG
jgi:hypothetical protein